MAEYDKIRKQWVLRTGDLAYWLDRSGAGRVVRCRIELVTHERVYLRATADDPPRHRGEVWWEARFSRRVAPREAVYVYRDRGHVDWRTVRIEAA